MEKLTLVSDFNTGDSFVIGVVCPVIYKIIAIQDKGEQLEFLLSNNINNLLGFVDYFIDETLLKVVK